MVLPAERVVFLGEWRSAKGILICFFNAICKRNPLPFLLTAPLVDYPFLVTMPGYFGIYFTILKCKLDYSTPTLKTV